MELLKKRFEFYKSECGKHLDILEKDLEELKSYFPLSERKIKALIQREDFLRIFDQIAYRFSKFQDTLGKLLKTYLILKGESVENLPLIDAVNLAYRYGFPIDEDRWWELRTLRNALTHEYPESYGEIAEAVNRIRELMPLLKASYEFLKAIDTPPKGNSD